MVTQYPYLIQNRFRGFLPVVVDVETGGINPQTDALLEIAAVTLRVDKQGRFYPDQSKHFHVQAFEGANLDPESLAFNKIDPDHPFRFAVSEKDALTELFSFLRRAQKESGCNRCVLVGHNAWFDLHFVNQAIARCKIKRSPFHPFTCFDTATLCALIYGQTVLAQALRLANIAFDPDESHSAIYDATKTAELFCTIVNQISWPNKTT